MIKILALGTKRVFEIDPKKGGENDMPCPQCSPDRNSRKQGLKCFSWNNTEMVGKCHNNCQDHFVLYREQKQKEYTVPEWKNTTSLSDKAVKWFTSRMISQATLLKMKVYSDVEFIPQKNEKRSVICFPYFNDGKLINIKFRDGEKNFKLVSGAELILYNIDSIKGKKECVIVEGEIDALSYITCGYDSVVSVPNGAGKNLEYLDSYFEIFEEMDRINIATDNDPRGIELREELIRRFGSEKCTIVNFRDVKDANEFICKYGGVELYNTIKNAIDIPVEGIINLNQHYDDIRNLLVNGMDEGLRTGTKYDEACTWELGRMAVVTGIPSHGKSEWLDYVLVRLNILNGLKVGYFSPENFPVKYHFSKLASKIVGKEFKTPYFGINDLEHVHDYIQNNFFFVMPEEDMTIDNILAKAKHLVKKHGIKVFVIDPYNKLDHMMNRGESETNYISKFLDKISMFARLNGVLFFLVAHPRKMGKDGMGLYDVPTLYDINGSANFYNKCDYGISVYRLPSDEQNPVNQVDVHFLKIKFKHLGKGGKIETKYNYKNGRYEPLDSSFDMWDFSNYLDKKQPDTEKDFWNNIEPSETTPFD